MRLLRGDIVDRLQERGDLGTAHLAQAELPHEVDTDADRELLASLGIDAAALYGRG